MNRKIAVCVSMALIALAGATSNAFAQEKSRTESQPSNVSPLASQACVGPVSFCSLYFGG
jgi:hypothetical protein